MALSLNEFRKTRALVTKDAAWCANNAIEKESQQVLEYEGGCFISVNGHGNYNLHIGRDEFNSSDVAELEKILYQEWYLREIADA